MQELFAVSWAMEAEVHVFSEVLPCQTMKEAVERIEAVERTGKIYCYLHYTSLCEYDRAGDPKAGNRGNPFVNIAIQY